MSFIEFSFECIIERKWGGHSGGSNLWQRAGDPLIMATKLRFGVHLRALPGDPFREAMSLSLELDDLLFNCSAHGLADELIREKVRLCLTHNGLGSAVLARQHKAFTT